MIGWKKTKIGEFLFEREGRFNPDDKSLLNLDRLEKIDFSGNFHIGQKASRTDMILIKRGDFVISRINVSKGAMEIYRESSDIKATIHYSSYTFDESKIDINYFEHFLQSAEFIKLLEDQVKGGIKTEIKAKHLLNLEILLPSLNEQKQIAEKLKISEEKQKILQQQINNQKTYLKNLRKQILQDAIEGKLTKEWREQNPDVESASDLLKKIKKEKEKLVSKKRLKKKSYCPRLKKTK
jgi:type I restriction enzyme S subunit